MDKTEITFEEFCKEHNVEATLPEITNVTEEVKKQMIATYKWEFIVKTLNNKDQEKEWIPDYSDRNQDKWELYVYYSPSVGWSLGDVDDRGHEYVLRRPPSFQNERACKICRNLASAFLCRYFLK
jgi:hypothetical protein